MIQEQVKIPDRERPYRHTSGMQVLLVEDDPALATVVTQALGSAGHRVQRVATGAHLHPPVAVDHVLEANRWTTVITGIQLDRDWYA